jgi:hypothetical protein
VDLKIRSFVKGYDIYTVKGIKTAFKDTGLKTLFQERLAHGPLSQHHFVLRLNELYLKFKVLMLKNV